MMIEESGGSFYIYFKPERFRMRLNAAFDAPPVEVACASGSRKSPQNRCKSVNYSQIEGSRYPLQLRWRPLTAPATALAAIGAAGMPVQRPRRQPAVSAAVVAGAGPRLQLRR